MKKQEKIEIEEDEEMNNMEVDKVSWVKDPDPREQDSDIVKLAVGESIEGIIMDIYESTKYSCKIYKVKVKDDPKTKVIIGTSILDRKMSLKKIGDLVKIERLNDVPSKKGRPMQMYETYSPKSGA